MLNLVFRNSTSDKKYGSKFFEKILKTVTRELKLKENFSVSVNLVGEKKIQGLNKKYRKKDKPTDVLSFPILDKPTALPRSRASTLRGRLRYPPTALDIGDIFVCLSIAKNEAKRENISIERKLAQLTVHGFLHLLGYNHEKSKRGAEEMFELERRILGKIEGL